MTRQIEGCGEVVTVDYDVEYRRFKGSVMEEWVKERAWKLGGHAWCWESPSGNTHCTICIARRVPLTEDERLALEIYFLDDPARIQFNLRRLMTLGRLEDRLFMAKVKWIPDPL